MDIDPAWADTDFYELLGVDRDAPAAEITKAYRRLARELHPDTTPGSGAEERFKSVSAAYRVLSDPEKRAAYDQARRLATTGGARKRRGGGYTIRVDNRGDAGDFGVTSRDPRARSIFDDVFGDRVRPSRATGRRIRPRTGASRRIEVTVPFEAAATGTAVPVRTPGGDRVTVRIPPGVADGQAIRIPGGAGGTQADLRVTVRVEPHRIFGRTDRGDLTVTVPISYSEAVLGADVSVPTLGGGPVRVRIPPGTPSGRVLRVRDRGLPTDGGRGDLLVTVEVDVPRDLTDRQRELIDELAEQDDPGLRGHLEDRR